MKRTRTGEDKLHDITLNEAEMPIKGAKLYVKALSSVKHERTITKSQEHQIILMVSHQYQSLNKKLHKLTRRQKKTSRKGDLIQDRLTGYLVTSQTPTDASHDYAGQNRSTGDWAPREQHGDEERERSHLLQRQQNRIEPSQRYKC
jgi:hypothetical protein